MYPTDTNYCCAAHDALALWMLRMTVQGHYYVSQLSSFWSGFFFVVPSLLNAICARVQILVLSCKSCSLGSILVKWFHSFSKSFCKRRFGFFRQVCKPPRIFWGGGLFTRLFTHGREFPEANILSLHIQYIPPFPISYLHRILLTKLFRGMVVYLPNL